VIGVLRRRDFLLVWTGGLVSVAGDWMLVVVLPYVVYATTGSTFATAGMVVAELVPGIALGSFAGVFVDRWDLRRLLVVSNVAQAASVSLLLLAPAAEVLALVYAVAALQSAVAAFSQPAESALLPRLVPEGELVAANALNVLNNRLGRLAGLPLGSLVYATAGLHAVVLVDALTFLGAAGLVALVRPQPLPPPPDSRARVGGLRAFLEEWVDGLRVIGQDRTIAVLFLAFGLMTFGGTMFDPLVAAWVRDVLHAGAGTYAALMTAHAASGIAGSLLVGAWGDRVAPRLLTGWASVVAGVLLLVRFNVPVVSVALAISLLQGLFAVASAVGVEALAQQRVPAAHRGRVFGSLQATVWLLSLLGAVVGGVGAELVGLVPMLDAAALLTLLAGVVVLVMLPGKRVPARWREDSSSDDVAV
jgi:MFS family permease